MTKFKSPKISAKTETAVTEDVMKPTPESVTHCLTNTKTGHTRRVVSSVKAGPNERAATAAEIALAGI